MTGDARGACSAARRLIFVRHARALDIDGRCIGQTDVPLCSEAEESLRRVFRVQLSASSAGALPAAIDTLRVVSSDLARAERTARMIAESMGLPVSVDRRLRELSFGDWDGRTWVEIEQGDGARFKSWMDGWATLAPPGGETVDALFARAASWLDEVLNRTTRFDRTIVAVSHAGWIRAVVCQLLGIAKERMFDVAIDNAHATVIELQGGKPVLVAENVEVSPELIAEVSRGRPTR